MSYSKLSQYGMFILKNILLGVETISDGEEALVWLKLHKQSEIQHFKYTKVVNRLYSQWYCCQREFNPLFIYYPIGIYNDHNFSSSILLIRMHSYFVLVQRTLQI